MEKKDAFDNEVDGPLVSAIKGAPMGTSKLHLWMHLVIYIKTQKKVHLRPLLKLHLRLHLIVHLMFQLNCICIALLGALISAEKFTKTLICGLNVTLEVRTSSSLQRTVEHA